MTEAPITSLTPQELGKTHDLLPNKVVEAGHIAVENTVQPRTKSLEELRFGIRGNDEAVHEIGTEADQQRLNDILVNPGSHTRDELLETTFANYSGKIYGDKQWVKKIGAWGDAPEVVTAYGQLMEAHPEWAQLSLDAGFMTHLSTFMDMLDKGEVTATDYEGARQQLKDRLGGRTVWRGTMLTDEELARLQTEGLGSPLSRAVQNSKQPQEQFEAAALSAWPSYTIESHFDGAHMASPFLSVSEHPDIAISVGRHFGDKSPGKKFYLLKLSVPAIDLVSYTDHVIDAPFMFRRMQERDTALRVGVNGEQNSYKWEESVENFVFWKLDASEILKISQPDITESMWNNRVTGRLAE